MLPTRWSAFEQTAQSCSGNFDSEWRMNILAWHGTPLCRPATAAGAVQFGWVSGRDFGGERVDDKHDLWQVRRMALEELLF
jgi:hypothetical protein